MLSSLISILIGLIVGAIVVLIVGLTNSKIGVKGALEGVRLIFAGILSTGRSGGQLTWGFNAVSIGNMLFRAMPLVMTGLSVAVAFKTGLFNIGAPGQYLMGTMVSLMLALGIPTTSVPAWLVWIIAFLGGMLAGAVWGAIPGIVKAFLNINEVLACIMTNWIAANLVTWAFDGSRFRNLVESTKSSYIYKTSFNGVATPKLGLDKLFPGSQVNAGILVAVLLAVLMYILMNKTTLGYKLKAVGFNRFAAEYGGISSNREILTALTISGMLSGLGGACQVMGMGQRISQFSSQEGFGFQGITVALIASSNPIGCIFSGLFYGAMKYGGSQLTLVNAPSEIVNIIMGTIIFFIAIAPAIKKLILRGRKGN